MPRPVKHGIGHGRSHAVLIVIPSVYSPFFDRVVHNVRIATTGRKCLILVNSYTRRGRRRGAFVSLVVAGRVSNVLLLNSELPFSTDVRRRHGLPPVIVTGRFTPRLRLPAIRVSGLATTFSTMGCLCRRKRGQVNYVTNPRRVPLYRCHLRNCIRTLHHYNVVISPRCVTHNSFAFRTKDGTVRRLLSLPRPPATIFYRDSIVTLNTLSRTGHRKLGIPRSLSVVNFSGVSLARFYSPPLAAVTRPHCRVNQRTVLLLLSRVRKRRINDNSHLVSYRLVVQKSAHTLPWDGPLELP